VIILADYCQAGGFLLRNMMPDQRPEHDPVTAPSYYRAGDVYETIRVLRAWLTPEQFEGMLIGNTLKYLSRAGKKGDALEDCRKARVYLSWYIEELEKRNQRGVQP
jgi:Protein of unknwon function (DUF3310)